MASANPATVPVASCVEFSLRVKAVPLVPSETTADPDSSPRPRPAAMLSPVPGAIAMPSGVWPTTSAGSATRGRSIIRPSASSTRSSRYLPLAGSK